MRLNQPSIGLGIWTSIETEVGRILDARLDRRSAAPIAVALSGGGDSVALLLAARRWARDAGRTLIGLTVDHRLSPLSRGWTASCAERAGRLGLEHRALVWDGEKPQTGRPAAARLARHRLLARAARKAGASVILVGHTADDRLEARAMRAEGCSVSEPRVWSPSPAWPEGRGVFILRPLIDIRRAAIRRGLAECGEPWLDDPANVDDSSLRARVRRRIADGGEPGSALNGVASCTLFPAATVGWAGDVEIDIAALRAAPTSSRIEFLSMALVCAAGGTALPRGKSLDRLWARVAECRGFVATLAGARVESDADIVHLMRDDGALTVSAWTDGVFDGRYEIDHAGPVFPLGGHMAMLGRGQREALKTLPPAARRALPAVKQNDDSVSCPIADGCGRSLVAGRLAAACGVVTGEATIERVGEMAFGVLNTATSVERSVHEPA